MKIKEAIQTLKEYNKWRRDNEGKYQQPHPFTIGLAIDIVVNDFEANQRKKNSKRVS